MRSARTFVLAFTTALALYAAIGFLLLPNANFYGDLTRIGKIPETYFGWTRHQPAIDPKFLHSAKLSDADLLVIGDSFSAPLIWQSALTEQGLKVATVYWSTVRAICSDFVPWLEAHGFKGKYIVIQIIERDARRNLEPSSDCPRMNVPEFEDREYFVGPPASRSGGLSQPNRGKLSIGIRVAMNGYRYRMKSASDGFEEWDGLKNVYIKRVSGGCQYFSNNSCRDALFLKRDKQPDLGQETIRRIEGINAHIGDKKVIWLVIPDKTTAYIQPDKKFWDLAGSNTHLPNLLQQFRGAIDAGQVDFYAPNDTHLSSSGYLFLGKYVHALLH